MYSKLWSSYPHPIINAISTSPITRSIDTSEKDRDAWKHRNPLSRWLWCIVKRKYVDNTVYISVPKRTQSCRHAVPITPEVVIGLRLGPERTSRWRKSQEWTTDCRARESTYQRTCWPDMWSEIDLSFHISGVWRVAMTTIIDQMKHMVRIFAWKINYQMASLL
jgi:hypothetical protein